MEVMWCLWSLLSMCLLCPRATLSTHNNHTNNNNNHTNNNNHINNNNNATVTKDADGIQTPTNEAFDDSPEKGAFSGLLEYNDLAGIRSFLPEQEEESRIIQGKEAWAHSWPWQVSVCFASMPACGGAIVGNQWVLTAAHCFKRFKKAAYWSVVVGKHDLDHAQEAGQQSVGVVSIVRHHRYNPRTKENDVALLKLQQPLVYGTTVRPIHVWTQPLPLLKECTVTGWGATRENGPRAHRLQEVNVTVLPPDTCNRFYKGRIRSSMYCAGNEKGGSDACQGDSGGPMSCYTGSRFELAGLVSWGIGCGRKKHPGVYTKMSPHTQWLHDHLNNLAYDDESEEEKCGRVEQSPECYPPGLAALKLSPDGQVSVENLMEPCPSFWPWQVSLQSHGQHVCSGVLVHNRWILAAKHCIVKPQDSVAVLGIHDLQLFSTQAITVDKVFNLPQEARFPPKPDLLLLRLSIQARIEPACLPDEDEELNDSWHCFTVGWGTTKARGDFRLVGRGGNPTLPGNLNKDRLHHVGLSLVNRTTCEDRWGGGFIDDSHICAHPAGSASCLGDSGAPLYCRKRGAYFLFGVLAFSSGKCGDDKPSVFTLMSEYHSWISDIIEDDYND